MHMNHSRRLQCLSMLQGINSGILRGAGLPTAAARINLMAYWLFGLPVVRPILSAYQPTSCCHLSHVTLLTRSYIHRELSQPGSCGM